MIPKNVTLTLIVLVVLLLAYFEPFSIARLEYLIAGILVFWWGQVVLR